MFMLNSVIAVSQLVLTLVMMIYFFSVLKGQYQSKSSVSKDSAEEIENLRKMDKISLTEPLTEKTRPSDISEVVGQEEGIKALRAALCGKNPQHILIYGPPGVGKTAASRVILKEAIKNPDSPFGANSKFVETDATTMQFDERSIADPLIGSVHDPIYQGAGAYGPAGVPQPKAGAVTKAHGGVLFIDEIGELSGLQMNRLLKVLEDRRVYFESSYYSSKNKDIPRHIHEIFQKGLPADFRLIGATTREPEEIPPALRSRCVEIYFRPLEREEIKMITAGAFKKSGMDCEAGVEDYIADYAKCGRDAVKIIQTAMGAAMLEKRNSVKKEDIKWVVKNGRFLPVCEKRVLGESGAGRVCGLAVGGDGRGYVLEMEVRIKKCEAGKGKINISGIIEEEEFEGKGRKLKKSSSVKNSVCNAAAYLSQRFDFLPEDYNVYINFPGGVPVDGPSAGVAVLTALYSAFFNIAPDPFCALTGEISIFGNVLPVGGVETKVSAAAAAGIKKVIIPKENFAEEYEKIKNVKICACENFEEVISAVFSEKSKKNVKENVSLTKKISENSKISQNIETISAIGG